MRSSLRNSALNSPLAGRSTNRPAFFTLAVSAFATNFRRRPTFPTIPMRGTINNQKISSTF
jgi:hypothetical protein